MSSQGDPVHEENAGTEGGQGLPGKPKRRGLEKIGLSNGLKSVGEAQRTGSELLQAGGLYQ